MRFPIDRGQPAAGSPGIGRRSRWPFARRPPTTALSSTGAGGRAVAFAAGPPEATWPGFQPLLAQGQPITLEREFGRLQREQRAHRRRGRNRRLLAAVLAVPFTLLLIAAIVVGPAVYQGARA
jgi:hypothetical protein